MGDGIRLDGRLQSRAYTKVEGGLTEQRTAYEVSVMHLEILPEEPVRYIKPLRAAAKSDMI